MGELRPSPPTEQAVNREISLDVVDEEQMGFLARKPICSMIEGAICSALRSMTRCATRVYASSSE